MLKVGTIMFDSTNNRFDSERTIVSLENGWASVAGGEAKQVQSIHDLPNDVLWLTNLSYTNFYRAGLSRHPNFRADNWLRTTLNQLVAEIGVDPTTTPIHTTVEVVSAIAHRVVRAAIAQYKVAPTSATLNEDFASALNAPKSNLPGNIVEYFKPIAEHPFVKVIATTNYSAACPTVTLRRNRLVHAQQVLSTQVPIDTAWEFEQTVPPDRNDLWLESVKTPFLARCTVSNVNPMIAEILSWGSSSRNIRDWLTDIEWRIVRQYSDVTVDSALICKAPAFTLPQLQKLPQSAHAALSFSSGLIAEQIWTAMTLKQSVRGDTHRYTAAAAWIRSADRMIMFEYAKKLHSRGVSVMSYGAGNVVAYYPEGGLRRVLDISTDIGLMPPTAKFREASSALETIA